MLGILSRSIVSLFPSMRYFGRGEGFKTEENLV